MTLADVTPCFAGHHRQNLYNGIVVMGECMMVPQTDRLEQTKSGPASMFRLAD